ncbi:UNVERIFIED_CONTAM: hypothetical protein PYX00_009192 [Menopon gallinae]|uniref:Uncharacterized protein n=1 Tax=Menopon gallinae TaxID=328185 RepID=A0AAW2HAN1_9NEOP
MTAICFVCNLPILSHQVGLVWQGGNGWDDLVREQVEESTLRQRLGAGRRDSAAQITSISPPTETQETSPPASAGVTRRRRSSLAQLTDILREWGGSTTRSSLRGNKQAQLCRRETLADLAKSLPWGKSSATDMSSVRKRRESSADSGIKSISTKRRDPFDDGHFGAALGPGQAVGIPAGVDHRRHDHHADAEDGPLQEGQRRVREEREEQAGLRDRLAEGLRGVGQEQEGQRHELRRDPAAQVPAAAHLPPPPEESVPRGYGREVLQGGAETEHVVDGERLCPRRRGRGTADDSPADHNHQFRDAPVRVPDGSRNHRDSRRDLPADVPDAPRLDEAGLDDAGLPQEPTGLQIAGPAVREGGPAVLPPHPAGNGDRRVVASADHQEGVPADPVPGPGDGRRERPPGQTGQSLPGLRELRQESPRLEGEAVARQGRPGGVTRRTQQERVQGDRGPSSAVSGEFQHVFFEGPVAVHEGASVAAAADPRAGHPEAEHHRGDPDRSRLQETIHHGRDDQMSELSKTIIEIGGLHSIPRQERFKCPNY